MEQIKRGVNRSHFVHPIWHFSTSSPRIFITLLLLVSFFTAALAVNTLAKHFSDPYLPDLFTAFTDFFPGQSLDARILEAEGFTCYFDTLPSPSDITERCTRVLQTGPFSHISVTIWDGIIKWFDLSVRAHGLTVGDLSLRWGCPKVRVSGNWVSFNWVNRHVTGSGWSYNGRFTYFQLLSQVSFTM